MEIDQMIAICDEMMAEAEQDATNLDGQPFNGKVVAEQLGQLYGAVYNLAGMMKEHLKSHHQEVSDGTEGSG